MENTNVEQKESNVIVISRTPVTANPRKLELFNVSYPEVYEATQDYFSTAKVVDPLGATVLTADGKINDHYQMTERGFQSLCTYIGVNANTVKAFWELDPEKTSNMMCQRINAVKKSKRIRYLTHGDTIEGFATDWYGEVPTTKVLESYNEINPDVNYTRVAFDGLRSRFTTLAPDAESRARSTRSRNVSSVTGTCSSNRL